MSNIQDTANQALQQMLTMAVNGLQGAVDFSKTQIPDVVHQMLMWNAVSSAIVQAVCLFIVVVYVIVAYKFCDSEDFDSDAILITLMVGLFTVGVPLTIAALNFDWLQILVAPKYYILQQAAHLVKS